MSASGPFESSTTNDMLTAFCESAPAEGFIVGVDGAGLPDGPGVEGTDAVGRVAGGAFAGDVVVVGAEEDSLGGTGLSIAVGDSDGRGVAKDGFTEGGTVGVATCVMVGPGEGLIV